MKKLFNTLIVSCLMVTVTFAQEKTPSEIPFTMDRNLIVIKGKLDKLHEYNFIFDTGTQGIIVSDSLAMKYNLKNKGFIEMKDFQGNTVGKMTTTKINSLQFNGLELINKEAVIERNERILSPNAVGIIGLSAFNGYLISIDYKHSKLILKKGKLTPNDQSIPINTTHILEAKIMLNGNKVLAHFDSGSPNFIGIPKEWETVYKLKAEPVFWRRARTPMNEFEIYKAQFDGQITIGKLVLNDPQITLVTGDFAAVNLGFEFFKQHLITIDAKNNLMQIQQI